MFINSMKQTKKDGTLSWKIQICESIRTGKTVKRRVVRHVGIAHRAEELERFERLAASLLERELSEQSKCIPLFECPDDVAAEASVSERGFMSQSIVEEKRTIEGIKEVYGGLFEELELGTVLSAPQAEVLKNVVCARVLQPTSKNKTSEILTKDLGFECSVDRIYRLMTTLSKKQSDFQNHVFSKTKSLFENKIDVVFFDVTTLYFESVIDDELRKFGYSKDQKFHMTQVVLALATTADGLPVGYKLFPGNTAESKTLLMCLNDWKKSIEIGRVIFVADRAMFSAANLFELQNSGYEFIVAAKLRGMKSHITKDILSEEGYRCHAVLDDQVPIWSKVLSHSIEYRRKIESGKWLADEIQGKLVCTYSRTRAKKDCYDREAIIEKMTKVLQLDTEKKNSDAAKLVSNSGYKKFAKFQGNKLASIDSDKIKNDALWDGMHGLFTNSNLETSEILARYRGLWSIEESFRISKHDLAMRPIYHFTKPRIEGHILLCYLALTVTRHLQHRLKAKGISLSPQRIRDELSRVQASVLFDKESGHRYKLPSGMSDTAKQIYEAIGIKRKLSLIKN